MEIFQMLPIEIQNKVKYYVLEHPTAVIIKDEIRRLKCDRLYKFKYAQETKCFCKFDGRDFFCNEFFRNRDNDNDDSSSSTDNTYIDEV